MFETAPRLFLIDTLRKDLLGPRQGIRETMPRASDPRDEYVSGLLDVDCRSLSPEEQSEVVLSDPPEGVEVCEGEEQEWDRPTGLVEWTPSCDPRREPSAVGLSWMVRGSRSSSLEVACTLAAYRRQADHWERQPFAWVQRFDLNQDRQEVVLEPLRSKLLFRCRERGPGCFQLNLMLVHLGWHDQPRTHTERLIFQPQLRVLLGEGLEPLGLWEFESAAEIGEESRLRLLYRDSPVMARGHFCAAVWRDIDPERPDKIGPWSWSDGALLAESDRQRFAACDLRTEFLPIMPVQTPSVAWDTKYGPPPQLSARKLADCSDVLQLRQALEPLLGGYQQWIHGVEQAVKDLPSRYQAQAREHLGLCQESLDRMSQGVTLLLEDAQSRAAFSFANQALAMQAEWKGVELNWAFGCRAWWD